MTSHFTIILNLLYTQVVADPNLYVYKLSSKLKNENTKWFKFSQIWALDFINPALKKKIYQTKTSSTNFSQAPSIGADCSINKLMLIFYSFYSFFQYENALSEQEQFWSDYYKNVAMRKGSGRLLRDPTIKEKLNSPKYCSYS